MSNTPPVEKCHQFSARSNKLCGLGIGGTLGDAGDAGQNLIRAFGPSEGFGMGIVGVEELGDACSNSLTAAVRSTPDLFGGQLRKPALH
jgi:hypothetical protein